jgi:hypothetical protein
MGTLKTKAEVKATVPGRGHTLSCINTLAVMNALALALFLVAGLAVSCSKNTRAVSFASIRNGAPFTAAVEEVQLSDFREKGMLVLISLRRPDGSALRIMQVSASTQEVAFARSLQRGQSYQFPTALTDYERRH